MTMQQMKKLRVKYISDIKSIFFEKGKEYDAFLPLDDESGRFFAFYFSEEEYDEAGDYALPGSRFEIITDWKDYK